MYLAVLGSAAKIRFGGLGFCRLGGGGAGAVFCGGGRVFWAGRWCCGSEWEQGLGRGRWCGGGGWEQGLGGSPTTAVVGSAVGLLPQSFRNWR